MRILFLSVIFATLLAGMFLLTIQQAPCHSSSHRIFLCHYNCLAEKRRRAAGIRCGSKYIFSIQSSMDCEKKLRYFKSCLLYTSDAADEEDSVDLGGRRIIK